MAQTIAQGIDYAYKIQAGTTPAGKATALANSRNFKIGDGTTYGTIVTFDGTGDVTLNLPSTISTSITGNSATATKLATSRTIAIGDGTTFGTAVGFDGSGNVQISLPSTINTNTSGSSASATKATQDASGNVITTSYMASITFSNNIITFLSKSGTTLGSADLTSFMKVDSNGTLTKASAHSASCSVAYLFQHNQNSGSMLDTLHLRGAVVLNASTTVGTPVGITADTLSLGTSIGSQLVGLYPFIARDETNSSDVEVTVQIIVSGDMVSGDYDINLLLDGTCGPSDTIRVKAHI